MGRKSREKRERKAQDERFRRNYLSPPLVKYPVQPRASTGTTASERALARLGRRTFLSLWSYPNVVRDERRTNSRVIAKEVADLLVVFEDHVIIFSDKDCAFPRTGNLDTDWARWYRKAIEKSAKQLWGAERWIREHPDRLFLDPKCEVPMPLPMPPADRMRIHRIVVAHGASDACRQELGGSGSLMIAPLIAGGDHCVLRAAGGTPFAVGHVDASKPFVHVLDDTSLHLLLKTLDTVSDFVGYLTKKEALVASGALGMATGEEGLLGWYLVKTNADDEHDFVIPPSKQGAPLAVDESWWLDYMKSPDRLRKEAANKVSYLWDYNIELFTGHFMAGTSDHQSEVASRPEDFERVLRFFARENRTRRRMLARALIDMHRTTPADMRRLRILKPSRRGDPYWVLLLIPFAHEIPYREYRDGRREYLRACLQVTKLMHPDALDIVGFATESGRGSVGSEDALYYDARPWTDEDAREASRLQRELEILVRPTRIEGTEHEYPPAPGDPPA